ncbi:MAG: DNRLRE domain-containing protein [Deltaproteobacteria bacterium]|nr:DNRLRE domain-containing protein [Deltaproteobacteria bacterium]
MKQRIFLTVFLLLMATASSPAMAQITITLDRAVINGQDITESRLIVVQPGEPLSGYLEVTVNSGEPVGTTVPVAATPNWWWDGYSTNAGTYTPISPGAPQGTQTYRYDLPADLWAPYFPAGAIYYIGVFAGVAEDEAHLMSCDKSNGQYVWDTYPQGETNALDVSNWSNVYWDQAVSGGGSVQGFKFCSGTVCGPGSYGGAAIMVQIASAQVEKELSLPPAADTFISSSNRRYWDYRSPYPTYEKYANYGSSSGLAIVRGKFGMFGSFSDWRGSLIRFDLSEVPPNATIEEANLCLYQYMVWGEQVSVHRMRKDWKELEASWYEPYKGGELWWGGWTNGQNYERTASDLKSVTKEGWFCWNVKEDVKIFVNNAEENFGWFLKSAATTGSDETTVAFYSKNMRQDNLKPYLYVRYTVSGSGPIGFPR